MAPAAQLPVAEALDLGRVAVVLEPFGIDLYRDGHHRDVVPFQKVLRHVAGRIDRHADPHRPLPLEPPWVP